MLRATLKSLAARKLRLGMSAFAIVIGVAFVVGSYVFTDTLNRTFNDIFGDLSADVVVRPATPEGQESWATLAGAGSSVTIPAQTVEEIGALPEVASADGEIESSSLYVLDRDGDVVGVAGAPGVAVNWYEEPTSDDEDPVLDLVEGRAPERSGEVALDDQTIDTTGYQIGDEIPMVTLGDQPRITAELVGVVRFGESGSLAGATLAAFDTATAQELFLDGENAFNRVSVTAAEGVDAESLRDTVAGLLPDNLEAMTGEAVDDETASAVEEGLGFFNTFLLIFAAIALFVGIFLILNTFSILVAQRSQEMALFRALGASRRQVTRSVMLEAVVVGLVGATLGLLLGLAVAVGLQAIFAAFGMDFGGGLVLQPRTVIVAYVVGVLVTMVAAFVPARRASKVPPVAAMRDDVVLPSSSRRNHVLSGGVLVVGGAAAMAAGLLDIAPSAAVFVGLGILAVFIGVALLAPVISVPIVRVIAGWYPKTFGTVGRLAKENALRNPRRTAATASALMIGLALVSSISVVGASANKSIDEALDRGMNAEFVIASVSGQPFSPAIADAAREIDGVSTVAVMRGSFAVIDGSQSYLSAVDPDAFNEASELTMVEGTMDLSGGGLIVDSDTADSENLAVGDTVPLDLGGSRTEQPVAGVYDGDHPLMSGYVTGLQTLEELGITPADSTVYVVTESGADLGHVQADLEEATSELPMVTVQNQEEYKASQRDQVNQLLYIVYALLGLGIVIAILGIVNTLALSVMERTREVGLLRAVGLSRRQLRTTIRLESVAIAVLGAVLGIGLGLIFGVSLQRAVADEGLDTLSVPFGQLITFVILAALVGILAAAWPARRAAKLDVLRAINTE
ncbi:ABC transporter permease [Phytoactinopolyspora halotolerans]|uniref:FtsX-like permease family protein n=1 Tax=Phytoactinopolyspora halotolerans TaxID=1981512 RepID=A0A6L9SDI9_9ACTN|nr:FtsX-like permease family protein [Phytoactinopolyspora halotolerans]NEE03203.1 FtsX-like permease family protein [Phytoactinopolyspora halotolerans]